MTPARQSHRCHICGAEMSSQNPEVCKNFHIQQAHTSAPAPERIDAAIKELERRCRLLDDFIKRVPEYEKGMYRKEGYEEAIKILRSQHHPSTKGGAR